MSDLSKLKSQLHSLAQDAQKTAGQVSAFENKFSRNISEVQQAIGGSSTGADRRIVEILQGASKAVKQASEALQGAARSAKHYADSI